VEVTGTTAPAGAYRSREKPEECSIPGRVRSIFAAARDNAARGPGPGDPGPPGGGQGRVEEGPIRVMRIDNFGEYETKDGHHDGPMPRSLRGDEDARALDVCGDARPKHGEPRPEKSHRINRVDHLFARNHGRGSFVDR
jgi:hypothetical protein